MIEVIEETKDPRLSIRQIMRGKLYDTAKAMFVIVAEARLLPTTPCKEGHMYLYRTDKGNFFAYLINEEELICIDDYQAKQILAYFPDLYVRYFGEVEEA